MNADTHSVGMTALNTPSEVSNAATFSNSTLNGNESEWRAAARRVSGFFKLF